MNDVLIIRHGQSEWNLEGRWQGWLDAPLTALGEHQAHHRAETLVRTGFRPAVVVCSDLGRAHRTAEIIAAALDVPCRADPGFRERSGGEWEGYTIQEIEAKWPEKFAAWRAGDRGLPPGSEHDDHVYERVDVALATALAGPRPLLIVTHGGTLRLVATRAGVDVNALTPNLGGFWFRADGGRLVDPEPIDPLPEGRELPTVE